MGRIIAITSGKGGVGKTTITAGLGMALSFLGQSVCMIDLDFGLNNLDLVLNIEEQVVYDMADYLTGRCKLRQALTNICGIDNLFYLGSGKVQQYNSGKNCDIESMIKKIASVFDYVLLDSPAGIGYGFDIALKTAGEIIIVATPNVASIRDANKVKNKSIFSGEKTISLVVNRIRGDLVASNQMITESQISKAVGVKLIGVLPENDNINIISNTRRVYDCCDSSLNAFNVLAKNVHFNRNKIVDYLYKYKGIFGAIKCKLKKQA